MDPAVETFWNFGIDVGALADKAAEGRLDVGGWTAKPVVKVKMAKGRIQIVPPHQADDAAAKPNAFGIAGGSIYQFRRLGEFIDLLGFLGTFAGGALLAGLGVGILRLRDARGNQQRPRAKGGGNTTRSEKGHGLLVC
jgi:hypothetical protein